MLSPKSEYGKQSFRTRRGHEKEYLDAGWWLGLGRALITYLIIFAMAPLVAHFYGFADLSALLRITLLGTLFDGAMSPRSALAQKHMKLGRWMVISNGGGICGVILTVVLSFLIRDVWALAVGFASESAFRCLFSYILYPGLPSFSWKRDVVRDLYGFSKQAFGLSFLNLIFSRADIFVLGKLYPATELGLYSMGVALILTPSTFITNMLAQTLFPAFTHVQNDKERINRILIEVTSWMVLLGLPGVAVIWLCGRSLLSVPYGARYVAAAAPLAVAAAVVFLNLLNVVITCVFTAVGRPALHRRAVAASAVVMLIAIYPACKLLGTVGGQVAALLAIIVSYLLQVIRMRALTGLNLLRYGRTVLPAALGSSGNSHCGLWLSYVRFDGQARNEPHDWSSHMHRGLRPLPALRSCEGNARHRTLKTAGRVGKRNMDRRYGSMGKNPFFTVVSPTFNLGRTGGRRSGPTFPGLSKCHRDCGRRMDQPKLKGR